MWVGGAGVSRGYINLPELTARRYKLDKFANDGSMMFNTGDIVQWREDGSLNTFGRADDQVKLKKYQGITRACATVIEGILYAFYTASTSISEHDLDEFVKRHLPYYSVPERWVILAAIPLTSNGKVNKKELASLALQPILFVPQIQETSNSTSLVSSESETSSSVDIEKDGGSLTDFSTENLDLSTTVVEKPESLPSKNGFHGQRWLRHRAFIVYRKFFSVIVMANFAAAVVILYLRVQKDRRMLADLATATATNLCVAVLMRCEPVINSLFTLFCSVPLFVPLSIRKHCARIFHIGGIHSGCALSATMWFGILAIGVSLDYTKGPGERCISLASIVLTYLVLLLLVIMASLSHPKFRAKYHNTWEMTHRFGGWTALILLWIQAFFTTKDLNVGVAPSKAYLNSPPIWLLTVATMAIIFPWLHLRKVPVRSEVLSSHAIRLHFDYTTPVVGTAVRLAERPLMDWHGFATITNANGKGFSLIVSNAGDFTKRTIERAPSHIWVRGIPACGVLRICTVFKSVVLVATGSGIGPCLAVILAKKTPARILWTAPNPEQTFGKDIINAVLDKDPKAVIHNTRTMGKPNMSLMAYQLWKESGAEAVCVISNKTFTTKIVYALEARGIPAYGAIFDS
ncbi:hypothetical protein N0V90_005001 [Kalmusia sp. IMI 367209]|nr:hypothetical protein N0V90_005001 [Kalmusia sp. IMI 367209]